MAVALYRRGDQLIQDQTVLVHTLKKQKKKVKNKKDELHLSQDLTSSDREPFQIDVGSLLELESVPLHCLRRFSK